MKSIGFHSKKGGVGKTTLVCGTALYLDSLGHNVVVISSADTHDIMGVAYSEQPVRCGNNIWIADSEIQITNSDFDYVLYEDRACDVNVIVTTQCYLSLKNIVRIGLPDSTMIDGIVLFTELGRALTALDVERALGSKVLATILRDPRVSRAVDAGLLAHRTPEVLMEAVAKMMSSIEEVNNASLGS